MPVRYSEKPFGISSHQVNERHFGFIEHLEKQQKRKLWPCHRLDKGTTGVFCYADDRESAAQASQLFESGNVAKTYFFVTDRAVAFESYTHSSHIKKENGQWISQNTVANSSTIFKKVKTDSGFTLVEASPQTGKPHQIRLHAQDLGMPILGDNEHGGSQFPIMLLHAKTLQFRSQTSKWLPENEHISEPPSYYQNLEELCDPDWVEMYAFSQRALRLYPNYETVRLLHSSKLTIDKLGSVLWISWFLETPPSERDLARFAQLAHKLSTPHWHLRLMLNRGKDPISTLKTRSLEAPDRWTAREHGIQFEFRSDTGTSSGLFLDQRENRKWVYENSRDLSILNLFCYTGGFSVAAAIGGAKEVVSVDSASSALDWAKRNFEINQISLSNEQSMNQKQFEFFRADAILFLNSCKKRNRKFDLVICDPPSFGRSQEGVFQLARDFKKLLGGIAAILNPGGRILFSTNFEGWDQTRFESEIKEALPECQVQKTPEPDWDFEVPGQSRILKSALIRI